MVFKISKCTMTIYMSFKLSLNSVFFFKWTQLAQLDKTSHVWQCMELAII